METRAKFEFRCGTPRRATEVAHWLRGEKLPDDLRAKLDERFETVEEAGSEGIVARAKGEVVSIEATGEASVESTILILDYALQKSSRVPSPQGFSFSLAPPVKPEDPAKDELNIDAFDGGGVVLEHFCPPRLVTGRYWLSLALNRQCLCDDHSALWRGLHYAGD